MTPMTQSSSRPPRIDLLSAGLGAVLALGALALVSARPVADQDGDHGRYQIRVISQESGAAAVVMVDSKTGEAWAQRLASGLDTMPWVTLGKPE